MAFSGMDHVSWQVWSFFDCPFSVSWIILPSQVSPGTTTTLSCATQDTLHYKDEEANHSIFVEDIHWERPKSIPLSLVSLYRAIKLTNSLVRLTSVWSGSFPKSSQSEISFPASKFFRLMLVRSWLFFWEGEEVTKSNSRRNCDYGARRDEMRWGEGRGRGILFNYMDVCLVTMYSLVVT